MVRQALYDAGSLRLGTERPRPTNCDTWTVDSRYHHRVSHLVVALAPVEILDGGETAARLIQLCSRPIVPYWIHQSSERVSKNSVTVLSGVLITQCSGC